MPRFHATAQGPVQFTAAEEAEWDSMAAAAAAAAPLIAQSNTAKAAILALEGTAGFGRKQREFMLAKTSDAGLRAALSTIEAQITIERAKITK